MTKPLTLASALLCVLLLLATHARLTLAVASCLVLTAGVWEWSRARHRLRDDAYASILTDVRVEIGLARLQVLCAAALFGCAFLVPPAAAAGMGAIATILILAKSILNSARLSEDEEKLKLVKGSAAAECPKIDRLAELVIRVRVLPGLRWIPGAAHYERPSEHVSVLRAGSLLILLVGCAAYFSIGLGLGAAAILPVPTLSLSIPAGIATLLPEADDLEEGFPTYAELCPGLPDPLAIGHELGPLFRRDGAIKAGCGAEPVRVPNTGTWAAPGYCEGDLRSLAVSAPGIEPAIVYGAPAEIAWSAVGAETLVAIEAAAPNEGDLYLLMTRSGTLGFVRPTRSITVEDPEPRSCADVSGVARSFAVLEPVMVVLWLELMKDREEWIWPKPVPGDPTRLAFTDEGDAVRVAEGYCISERFCSIQVDGETLKLNGSGYVSLVDLAPYLERVEA